MDRDKLPVLPRSFVQMFQRTHHNLLGDAINTAMPCTLISFVFVLIASYIRIFLQATTLELIFKRKSASQLIQNKLDSALIIIFSRLSKTLHRAVSHCIKRKTNSDRTLFQKGYLVIASVVDLRSQAYSQLTRIRRTLSQFVQRQTRLFLKILSQSSFQRPRFCRGYWQFSKTMARLQCILSIPTLTKSQKRPS